MGPVLAAVEHRPYDVDDPARLHVAGVARRGLTRGQQADAVAELLSRGELLVAAGDEDRTVDTAAAHQAAVGGVDHRIDVLVDDVPSNDDDLHRLSLSGVQIPLCSTSCTQDRTPGARPGAICAVPRAKWDW